MQKVRVAHDGMRATRDPESKYARESRRRWQARDYAPSRKHISTCPIAGVPLLRAGAGMTSE